jgi:hypothetical protein
MVDVHKTTIRITGELYRRMLHRIADSKDIATLNKFTIKALEEKLERDNAES